MKTAVIVGNPKAKSRTLDAGLLVARKLTGRDPDMVVDIVELGAGLLSWGDVGVSDSVQAIQRMNVLIVPSPTYKATYTGPSNSISTSSRLTDYWESRPFLSCWERVRPMPWHQTCC